MREDRFTATPEDAAAYERAFSDYAEDDTPSLRDVADESDMPTCHSSRSAIANPSEVDLVAALEQMLAKRRNAKSLGK